ncbi:cardiolipin synthase [Breznakiellaceae bacterium SP9]
MKRPWVRVVLRRRVFVIAGLLLQIFFVLALAAGSSYIFRLANWAFHSVSIVVSLYILNKNAKSAFKLTWIFIILLFPIFGGLLYVIFHTQSNSRSLKRRITKSQEKHRVFYSLTHDALPSLLEKLPYYAPQSQYLQNYAGFPLYTHTQSEYFPSAEGCFERIIAELQKAQQYIFLEFFIVREGMMLDTILDILEEKAAAGIDVRFIYDDMGCFVSLPRTFKRQLEAKDIKCMIFNPFKPILSSHQNNRDHRKIIAIDGKVAFTGGFNLADEYINQFERFGHWKDCGIMIEGHAAWCLTLIFLEMWNLYHKQKDSVYQFYPWKHTRCTIEGCGFVQPYADSPIDDENVGEHVYIQIINNARHYVYINTPYLVVDESLLSALCLAAKSGVDVRIITPHRWDKKIVQICSQSYYRKLVSAGVKVYEYTKGFNHCKTFVSDDTVATVGTTNLDFRSLYLHFECGVLLYGSPTVLQVKDDFLATIPVSRLITLSDCARNAFWRIVQDVLRLFAPLM